MVVELHTHIHAEPWVVQLMDWLPSVTPLIRKIITINWFIKNACAIQPLVKVAMQTESAFVGLFVRQISVLSGGHVGGCFCPEEHLTSPATPWTRHYTSASLLLGLGRVVTFLMACGEKWFCQFVSVQKARSCMCFKPFMCSSPSIFTVQSIGWVEDKTCSITQMTADWTLNQESYSLPWWFID